MSGRDFGYRWDPFVSGVPFLFLRLSVLQVFPLPLHLIFLSKIVTL